MSEFVTNMFQYDVTVGITRSEVFFLCVSCVLFPGLLCQTPRRSGKIPPRSGKIFFSEERKIPETQKIPGRRGKSLGNGKNPQPSKKSSFAFVQARDNLDPRQQLLLLGFRGQANSIPGSLFSLLLI